MVCTIVYVHTILRDTGRQFKVGSPDAYISANFVSLFHWGNPLVLPFRGDGLI